MIGPNGRQAYAGRTALVADARRPQGEATAEANDMPPGSDPTTSAGRPPERPATTTGSTTFRTRRTIGRKEILPLRSRQLRPVEHLQGPALRLRAGPASRRKPAEGHAVRDELEALGTSARRPARRSSRCRRASWSSRPSRRRTSRAHRRATSCSRTTPSCHGSDIKDPKQASTRSTNEPIVTFNFTDKGREAFARVTKRMRQRGSETILPPGAPARAPFQHFAITLDDEIVSLRLHRLRREPRGHRRAHRRADQRHRLDSRRRRTSRRTCASARCRSG